MTKIKMRVRIWGNRGVPSKNEWIWVKWPVWISLNRKQNSSKKSAGTTKLVPRSVSLLPLSFCRLTHLCGFWLEVSFQSHAFAILIGRINFLRVKNIDRFSGCLLHLYVCHNTPCLPSKTVYILCFCVWNGPKRLQNFLVGQTGCIMGD